jgi:glycerate kinase
MLAGTDLVISGEGRIDAQTLHGKVIMGIAKRTKKQGVPLLALAGSIGSGTESLYEQGVTAMFPIAPGPITLQESMQRSQELLADTAQRCLRLILGTVLSP